MADTTELVSCEGPTSYAAAVVYRERKRQGLSSQEIINRANDYLEKKRSDEQLSSNMLKRLEAARPNVAGNRKNTTKLINLMILEAIGNALQLSMSELFPPNWRAGPLTFDPLMHPDYADRVLNVIQQYSAHNRTLVGWAQYIPCSLESRDFMEAHHKAFFAPEMDLQGLAVSQTVDRYNKIGNKRRELFESNPKRPSFTHIMFSKDFQAIIDGDGVYKNIPKYTRQSGLAHLKNLIRDNEFDVTFLLVPESDELLRVVEGKDSCVVLDDNFTFWRQPWGTMYCTPEKRVVETNTRRLEKLMNATGVIEGGALLSKIDDFLEI